MRTVLEVQAGTYPTIRHETDGHAVVHTATPVAIATCPECESIQPECMMCLTLDYTVGPAEGLS
ncbi:MAG: hypothetical protein QXS50_02515 [Candidatus Caldarchaeum sp.]